jgi:hypothetical protein
MNSKFFAVIVVSVFVLMGYLSVKPSNNRVWQKDVAVLAYASVNNNLVTVHNIRNFTYRSEFDYTPVYYDKTFDVNKLQGIDLIAVYWMGPKIAHIFLSFDFGTEGHLAISIETRKEKGEEYSTLKGFFRQYELYYVVADERDVIGLRSNYRNNPQEDVYIYKTKGSAGDGKRLFMEYIREMNRLKDQPEFYNSLTTNCTTNIWLNSRVNENHLPFHWKVLVSGYVPEYLYEQGRLVTHGLSFSQLQKASCINEKAHRVGIVTDFSSQIRDNNGSLFNRGSHL